VPGVAVTPAMLSFTVKATAELNPLRDTTRNSGVEVELIGTVINDSDDVSMKSTIFTVTEMGTECTMPELFPRTSRL